jgi:tetratricopeptide (TPR) repeat protein
MATRSMSEDELEGIEGKARKLTILDLNKRALAAKQGGDLETAMGCLKKAKKIEVEDSNGDDDDDDEEPPYSSTLPLFWKKVALLCKQAGDLDRAKQALVHSKELEAAETANGTEPEDSDTKPPGAKQVATPAPAVTPNQNADSNANEEAAADGNDDDDDDDEDLPPPLYHDFDDLPPPPPPAYDNLLQNCQVEGASAEEAAMLAELMGGGSGNQERSKINGAVPTPTRDVTRQCTVSGPDADANADVSFATSSNSDHDNSFNDIPDANPAMTFTDEELRDEEMMLEFASGGVKGIPTTEEYASKVLSYKKLALKFKQEGNIPKATQNLRTAKQLEKVSLALQKTSDLPMDPQEDPQSWLETLNPEESELLGELLNPDSESGDGSAGEDFGFSGTDRLTIEDLQEMDDDNDVMELVDMMGPDALPTVEEVTAKITEEKQKALKYKQDGNIEMAKSSLLKSKKTKLLAMRLAEIYRKLEARKDQADSDGGIDTNSRTGNEAPVSLEDLEALVSGSPKPTKAATTPKKPLPPQPPKDPWLLKPSTEIKAEVIRLKNEKKVKEATRMLQLFKQKHAQEQKEADRDRVAKMVSTIQKRLEVSTTQRRLWQYYQWFGKETAVGASQYQEWTAFGNDCQKAIRLLETEGSTSVKLAPRLSGAEAANTNDPNSNGNPLAKKLYSLEDDVTSLVESCTNDTTFAATTTTTAPATTGDEATTTATTPTPNFLAENALEVAVLGLFQMEENEKLQKILTKKPKRQKAILRECPEVRIHAKLQLPIQPEDPSKPCLFDLEPSDLSRKHPLPTAASEPASAVGTAKFQYFFEPCSKSCRKEVTLPRKEPKHERTLLRRMETKTLQLSVFYLHNQNKRKEAEEAAAAAAEASKRKSWFFGRSETKPPENDVGSSEGESKDVFLGKVTIELKSLLSRGCLAGDFPILVNSKAIGGVLRVCLRTRPVLDLDRYEGLQWVPSDGPPLSLSIATYKQGLSFAFPNETNISKNQSIESIKESASC